MRRRSGWPWVWQRLLACCLLLPVAGTVLAHALQPGYLALEHLGGSRYDVFWKVPAVGGRPMPITAVLPSACSPRRPPAAPLWDGAGYLARWTAECSGGLEGGEVRIEGLEHTVTDVLVRYGLGEGGAGHRRLTPDRPAFTVPVRPDALDVMRTYLSLGMQHILGGIDHLLFVLALLLLVRDLRRLVWTITAFTLAHSITLAAATLGFVRVPGPPVEAVIALSIVFVAAEILHVRAGRPGIGYRFPWLVAFTFGLLHGFGFAGALAEVGLPAHAIPVALLFFNLGVEAGQLLFIGAVLAVMAAGRGLARRTSLLRPPPWAGALPAYGIGGVAAFWLLERLSAFA